MTDRKYNADDVQLTFKDIPIAGFVESEVGTVEITLNGMSLDEIEARYPGVLDRAREIVVAQYPDRLAEFDRKIAERQYEKARQSADPEAFPTFRLWASFNAPHVVFPDDDDHPTALAYSEWVICPGCRMVSCPEGEPHCKARDDG